MSDGCDGIRGDVCWQSLCALIRGRAKRWGVLARRSDSADSTGECLRQSESVGNLFLQMQREMALPNWRTKLAGRGRGWLRRDFGRSYIRRCIIRSEEIVILFTPGIPPRTVDVSMLSLLISGRRGGRELPFWSSSVAVCLVVSGGCLCHKQAPALQSAAIRADKLGSADVRRTEEQLHTLYKVVGLKAKSGAMPVGA